MTASSADPGGLRNVNAAQVTALLKIMRGATFTDLGYIETRYAEHARFFSETLALLETADWIVRRNDSCTLTDTGRQATAHLEQPDELRRLLVLATISRPGSYHDACTSYLCNFQPDGGDLSYAPAGSASLVDTGTRDFLMAMGVVERNIPAARFELTALGKELYLWATRDALPRSVEQLNSDWLARAELGRAAELAVLEYERRRLGEPFANQVHHVAAQWPTAPYDIKSVTIADGLAYPRFIEVKAVSRTDWHFYWTAREVAVAELMRSAYFLYLVPCSGGPRIESLRVINCPHANVLAAPEAWVVEPDVLSCRCTVEES